MKRSKFIIPFAVVAMLFSFGLAACGGGGNSSQSSQSSAQLVKINITAADDKTKLILGDNVQLTADVEGVAWSSTDEAVATVSAAGLVSSVAVGNVSIKASKAGYSDGSISIKVELEKIVVSAADDKTSLIPAETVQLTASTSGVAWASSDDTVATVSASGLVTGVKLGSVTITASKTNFTNGTIAINVVRPEATALLHFEDADHSSADGRWEASGRGPGATPIYSKTTASDGTCIAYFGAGDKEELKFTSDKAVKAELVVTMGNNSSFENLATVEKVFFNAVEISMEGKAFVSDGDGAGNYNFTDVSLGEVNLIVGDNILAFEFLASAPYIDDLRIYAEESATIVVVPAPAREPILVAAATLSVEEGKTVQIVTETIGVSYVSSDEAIATVNSSGLVTGVAKGAAVVTLSKEGMLPTTVAITVTGTGEIKVEAETGTLEDGMALYTPSTSASGQIIGTWPAGTTLTVAFSAPVAGTMTLSMTARASKSGSTFTQVNLATDVEFKLNDVVVALTGSTGTNQVFSTIPLGDVSVLAGNNVISLKAITNGPGLDYFTLAPKV